ncbi:MAG: hypothetical protein ABW185_18370 [Sedimenticola sp.]
MPHTEPQLSLRQLVHAYSTGRIDRHTYRSRRARLLDTLPARSSTPAQQPNREGRPAAAAPPTERKPPAILIIAIVVVTLIIVILGSYLLLGLDAQPSKPDDLSPQGEESTLSQQPTVTATTSQKHDLEAGIETFVKNNTWDKASRRRLLILWNNTDPEIRDSVTNSYWFRALDTELRTLIKEERGLSSPSSDNRAEALIAFGTHLGLNYP